VFVFEEYCLVECDPGEPVANTDVPEERAAFFREEGFH
jgi:hypothetical protein